MIVASSHGVRHAARMRALAQPTYRADRLARDSMSRRRRGEAVVACEVRFLRRNNKGH
jgi:hypothetical protein